MFFVIVPAVDDIVCGDRGEGVEVVLHDLLLRLQGLGGGQQRLRQRRRRRHRRRGGGGRDRHGREGRHGGEGEAGGDGGVEDRLVVVEQGAAVLEVQQHMLEIVTLELVN